LDQCAIDPVRNHNDLGRCDPVGSTVCLSRQALQSRQANHAAQCSPQVGSNRMPFVSYAQNFEDVMLWRALKHVDKGFYIDVGAAAPRDDSVTCAFSERGWRGINIEPNPYLFAELVNERPRDINLSVAVGDRAGTLQMSIIPGTGLST